MSCKDFHKNTKTQKGGEEKSVYSVLILNVCFFLLEMHPQIPKLNFSLLQNEANLACQSRSSNLKSPNAKQVTEKDNTQSPHTKLSSHSVSLPKSLEKLQRQLLGAAMNSPRKKDVSINQSIISKAIARVTSTTEPSSPRIRSLSNTDSTNQVSESKVSHGEDLLNAHRTAEKNIRSTPSDTVHYTSPVEKAIALAQMRVKASKIKSKDLQKKLEVAERSSKRGLKNTESSRRTNSHDSNASSNSKSCENSPKIQARHKKIEKTQSFHQKSVGQMNLELPSGRELLCAVQTLQERPDTRNQSNPQANSKLIVDVPTREFDNTHPTRFENANVESPFSRKNSTSNIVEKQAITTDELLSMVKEKQKGDNLKTGSFVRSNSRTNKELNKSQSNLSQISQEMNDPYQPIDIRGNFFLPKLMNSFLMQI